MSQTKQEKKWKSDLSRLVNGLIYGVNEDPKEEKNEDPLQDIVFFFIYQMKRFVKMQVISLVMVLICAVLFNVIIYTLNISFESNPAFFILCYAMLGGYTIYIAFSMFQFARFKKEVWEKIKNLGQQMEYESEKIKLLTLRRLQNKLENYSKHGKTVKEHEGWDSKTCPHCGQKVELLEESCPSCEKRLPQPTEN